jgi:hypothetical protein
MLSNGVRQKQVVHAVYLNASYSRHFYATHASKKPMTVYQETADIHSIGRTVLDVFHFGNVLPSQANLEIVVYSGHTSIEGLSPKKRVTPVRSQTGVI